MHVETWSLKYLLKYGEKLFFSSFDKWLRIQNLQRKLIVVFIGMEALGISYFSFLNRSLDLELLDFYFSSHLIINILTFL